MKKAILCLLILSCTCFNTLLAQEEISLGLPVSHDVIPPSPTAASLGEYGTYPVSMSTGVPNISIPLFDVEGNSGSIPVTLNYHGSGIKVDNVASWVGTGWSLQAGGVITRTAIGFPDEYGVGIRSFYARGFDPDTFDPISDEDDFNLFKALAKNGWTADPDIYTLNAMGITAQFIIDHNDELHLFSKSDIRIERINVGESNGFKVYTGDGHILEFFDVEETHSTTQIECLPFTRNPLKRYNSAWYLSRVYNGQENFDFEYKVDTVFYGLQRSNFQSNGFNTACGGQEDCFTYTNIKVASKRLTAIRSGRETAYFYPPTMNLPDGTTIFEPRRDLSGAFPLGSIVYQDMQIILDLETLETSENGWNTFSENDRYRLMLNGLTFTSSAGSIEPGDEKVYRFNYNTTKPLPARDSYKVDYYGYFSGKASNTFLPRIPDYFPTGANRTVNPSVVMAGMLEQIIYPTGGSTKFYWEPSHYEELVRYDRISESVTISVPNMSGSYSYNEEINIEEKQRPSINYNIGSAPRTDENGEVSIIIRNLATNQVAYSEHLVGSGTIEDIPALDLDPGNYRVSFVNLGAPIDFARVSLKYHSLLEVNRLEDRYLGGVRIRSISNFETEDTLAVPLKTKSYDYLEFINIGELTAYDFYKTVYKVTSSGNSCARDGRSSNPVRANHPTAYKKVREYIGTPTDNSGYTDYTFHDKNDKGGGILGTPLHDQSWKRSLVKKMETYNSTGELVQRISNNYQFINRNRYAGIKAAYIKDFSGADYFPPTGIEQISWRIYDIYSDWAKLESTTNTIIDEDRNSSVTTTQYNYFRPDIHVKPNKAITQINGNETNEVITLYPHDFSTNNEVFTKLKKHYFDLPIETVNRIARSGQTPVVTSAIANEYNTLGKPVRSFNIRQADVIDKGFLFANQDADPTLMGAYMKSNLYDEEPIVSISYHGSSSYPREIMKRNKSSCYLYSDAGGVNLAAEISNISFEELENIPGMSSLVSNTLGYSNATVKSKLIQIRALLPKTSTLTGYLYNNDGDLITAIDQNGRETHFAYDYMHRLVRVTDDEGNVLTEYSYNYR